MGKPLGEMRRPPRPGSAETEFTCLRDGCNKKVTAIAIRHGDPFCSKVCFQAHHGYRDAK